MIDDLYLSALSRQPAREYYLKDRACPAAYKPSGEDFLSPCLAGADGVRRTLPETEFAQRLTGFLPALHFEPTRVTDPSDGKLYHLAGLNLSRAWMLEGIASRLPAGDATQKSSRGLADRMKAGGIESITAEHKPLQEERAEYASH